jgi:hypothetical protein
VRILDGHGLVGLETVTVDPVSHAGVARVPEQPQDSPTADVSVAILSQRTFEPADPCRASDRVQAEGPDAGAVVAVDGEAHCGPVDVASIGLSGEGGNPLEVLHHLSDLAIVDAGRIPLDPIGRLTNVATDHALSHATHELLKGGLIVATELNTCLSGVVEELIVLNPEGNIPGFVVGPTVVGECHVRLLCLN